jgi:monoamine oxidase
LQLANGLSAQLPDGVVRLDSPVRRIDRGDGLIRAHLADHQLEARVAVIALPPALAITSNLIHGDDLQPAVTAVLADIPVWMGLTVEAVAVYEKPFWRAAGLSGTAMCPGLPLQEIHDMSGPDGSPVLQQPAWDGQLYWTSTETASIAPGHIEGALEAAERTVAAIVQTLG